MRFDGTTDRSLAETLHRACETNRARLALIEADRDDENVRWTYGDVLREGDRLASRLIENGLKPGDRCILLMPNQARWVVSAAAVLWAGGTLVPVDVKLNAADQASLIAYAEPKVVIADGEIWTGVAKELKGALDGTPVIAVNPASAPQGCQDWDAPAREPAAGLPVARGREDIASIIFTSGTGGEPKGCLLSHGAYLAQMRSLLEVFPVGRDDRYLSIIPANHVIDFMCGFLIPMATGAAVVHQRTLRSQYIVGSLKKYGITYTALVPLLLRAIQQGIVDNVAKLPPFKKRLLSWLTAFNAAVTKKRPRFWLSRLLLKPIHERFGGRLARIIVGGANVDKDGADFFYRMGIGVCIGYGLTEVCTAIALNDLHPYRGDTVGRLVPGGEAQIRNAGEDGVGELWVRAPFLMSGYFKNEAQTAQTIVDGWLQTGDLGSLDGSGHLKLLGRSKNMIVTDGGKNIYPEDVERTFQNIDDCDEYCVFASHFVWRDEAGKDRLILVVRTKCPADAEGAFAEKLKQANRRLDNHKRISGYLVWNEPFPRTASLKIKRDRLANAIRDGNPIETHVHPL